MDVLVIRLLFVIFVGVICFLIRPFNLPSNLDAVAGLLIGAAIIVFEWRLRAVSLKRLIGAAIGSILGIFGAYLFALVIRGSLAPSPLQSFLQLMVMMVMSYVGLAVGANKGDLLNLAALGGVFGGEKTGKKSYKILDTSVIIDGRIADIAETGFLDGLKLSHSLCSANYSWWPILPTRSSVTAAAGASTSCSVCKKLLRCRFRLWKTTFPAFAKLT